MRMGIAFLACTLQNESPCVRLICIFKIGCSRGSLLLNLLTPRAKLCKFCYPNALLNDWNDLTTKSIARGDGFSEPKPFVSGNYINSCVQNEAEKLPASAELGPMPGQVKLFPVSGAFHT